MTGPEFPLFLFYLCGLCVFLPQTGALLLLTVLLLRGYLHFRDREGELLEFWRKGLNKTSMLSYNLGFRNLFMVILIIDIHF